MQEITLIVYKRVILEIARGAKTKEYREYKKYYTSRFQKLKTPFKANLRGGYRKDALIISVIINKITIKRVSNNWLLEKLRLGKKCYVLHIDKLLENNVGTK